MMEKSQALPQLLAVFSAAFLAVGSGIQLSWSSPSVPKLLAGELGFTVSENEASYIVMLSPFAYVIGCPLYGFLLDRIGRKYTLILVAPVQAISWLLIAFSTNVVSLYIARILMGITDGGIYTALPAYMGEVAEPRIRGRAGTSHTLAILIGTLLINIFGSYTTIRTAAYISLSTTILFLITFIWMPESPYFLVSKGADAEAREALKRLRSMDDVEEELCRITKAVNRQMSEPGRFRDIFGVSSNLKAFIILVVLRTVQQLSGIFAVGFYMQDVFDIANSALPPKLSSIVCHAVRIPFTILGSILVDHFGRRAMITVSCFTTALLLAVMATYFYLRTIGVDLESFRWLPLAVVVSYYVSCSAGILVVPNVMMGELLSASVKAKALVLMNIYFGLAMSATSKLFQWTESTFGAYVPFYIFSISCLLGVAFTYTFVPETKGKTLEEIQQILKRTKNTERSRETSSVATTSDITKL